MATASNPSNFDEPAETVSFGVQAPSSKRPRLAHSRSRYELLDQAHSELLQAQDRVAFHSVLDRLISNLQQVRVHADDTVWMDWVRCCRNHPLRELFLEDPFTRRSCEKPRGYAGDAVLLDYIYGVEENWPEPEMSSLGQMIFEYTSRSAAPEGVRARRAYIARQIDDLAERKTTPDILSVACGHFREALLSSALKRKKLGHVMALDSDPRSLEVVDREYETWGIQTESINARTLLTGQADLGHYDLVYSLGLFDYLKANTSRRLASFLFHSLRPGGRLIIANFLPGIKDIGYMEAFMDWDLIYRNRREMIDMTMDIPEEEVEGISLKAEENQNIIFLEVTRS